jgi:hypothetical protein
LIGLFSSADDSFRTACCASPKFRPTEKSTGLNG